MAKGRKRKRKVILFVWNNKWDESSNASVDLDPYEDEENQLEEDGEAVPDEGEESDIEPFGWMVWWFQMKMMNPW